MSDVEAVTGKLTVVSPARATPLVRASSAAPATTAAATLLRSEGRPTRETFWMRWVMECSFV
jgi:hypothetical protein